MNMINQGLIAQYKCIISLDPLDLCLTSSNAIHIIYVKHYILKCAVEYMFALQNIF